MLVYVSLILGRQASRVLQRARSGARQATGLGGGFLSEKRGCSRGLKVKKLQQAKQGVNDPRRAAYAVFLIHQRPGLEYCSR